MAKKKTYQSIPCNSGVLDYTIDQALSVAVGQIVSQREIDGKVQLVPCNGSTPLGVCVFKNSNPDIDRVSVEFCRFIGQTNMFDPEGLYPVGANLFSDSKGRFTTIRWSFDYPAVATVMRPPTANDPRLQFMWL
jgi:hypothetical protein